MRRSFIPALLAVGLLAIPAAAEAAPRVYAAASLREAFPKIDGAPTYNFAGSNQLQTQIERGAPADVFASASPTEAQALFRAGRCTRPVTFATNIVVMLVPGQQPGPDPLDLLARTRPAAAARRRYRERPDRRLHP